MAANDKLSSNEIETVAPASQVPSPRVLEFYDPAAYLAAPYPVAWQPVAEVAQRIIKTAAKAEAAVQAPSPVDRRREHSRRAAQALAEVHSAARQRGLLKAPSTQSSTMTAPTGLSEAGVVGADAERSMSDRLVAVANWLMREGDISGLFLLDERGYSLLPKSEGSVGDDVILHDLGLRLVAVLDLVPQRLELAVEDFQKEAPIARLMLDGSRSLAVMRIAPQGALLAWIEASSMPLAAPLAQAARTHLLALLTENEAEDAPSSMATACSNAS